MAQNELGDKSEDDYIIIEKIKKDYKGKNVLIVTHSGVCAMIYCYLNNVKPNGRLKIPGIKNCELVEYRN